MMNRHDRRTHKRASIDPGLVYQLFAKTKPKRHKATATMNEHDWDSDVPSVKLSTAFMVILFLHVAVVGGVMLFRFLEQEADTEMIAGGRVEPAVLPEVPATNPVGVRLDDPALEGLPRHQVKPHETLDSIASQYGVTRDGIARTNRIDAENPFRIGMKLVIPPREGRAERPTASSGAGEMTVAVARPVEDLPKVERARAVDGSGASLPTAASGQEHVVKSGENLWAIAKRYKVDYKKLMKVNAITDPQRLQVGARLRIP